MDITPEAHVNIINNNLPAVIVFSAKWCGPCKKMTMIINSVIEILNKDSIDINIYKADVNDYEHLAKQYNVSALPTTVLIKGHIELKRFEGACDVTKFVNLIKEHQ